MIKSLYINILSKSENQGPSLNMFFSLEIVDVSQKPSLQIHPWKLTWHWKIPMFNRKHIFKFWISIVMLVFFWGAGYVLSVFTLRHLPLNTPIHSAGTQPLMVWRTKEASWETQSERPSRSIEKKQSKPLGLTHRDVLLLLRIHGLW